MTGGGVVFRWLNRASQGSRLRSLSAFVACSLETSAIVTALLQ